MSRALNNSTIWLKKQIIKYFVNCYINKQVAKVKDQQNKKVDGFVEKNTQYGLQNNPKNFISNRTGKTLSDIELKN